MIIEQIKTDGPKNLFLVHYDLKTDKAENVERVGKWLSGLPGYSVLSVPNGQPCPTNPLPKMSIFNVENKALLSAIEKISSKSTPSAIIPLKADEMKAWVEAQGIDMVNI